MSKELISLGITLRSTILIMLRIANMLVIAHSFIMLMHNSKCFTYINSINSHNNLINKCYYYPNLPGDAPKAQGE